MQENKKFEEIQYFRSELTYHGKGMRKDFVDDEIRSFSAFPEKFVKRGGFHIIYANSNFEYV